MRSIWVKAGWAVVALSVATGMGERLSLVAAPAMRETRAGHTATLLPNGKVLIAGGCVVDGCEDGLTRSAELYSPVRNTFSGAADLAVARVGHQAVRLPTNKVLVIGGWAGDEVTAVAELYDPKAGRFEVTGKMTEPRDGFTATRLLDGRVLITGGYNGSMNRLGSAELYDPETNRFTALMPMTEARMSHSASLLPDGRVLIVGGSDAQGDVLSSAELFDPETERFSPVNHLALPRHKHAAVTLQNGSVLIVGGAGAGDWDEQYNTTELFDLATLSFRPAATMLSQRFKLPDAITLLPSGEVLIAGGGAQAEIYHPETDTFSLADGILGFDLSYTTATLLPHDRVLIAGGYDEGIHVVDNAWLYFVN